MNVTTAQIIGQLLAHLMIYTTSEHVGFAKRPRSPLPLGRLGVQAGLFVVTHGDW